MPRSVEVGAAQIKSAQIALQLAPRFAQTRAAVWAIGGRIISRRGLVVHIAAHVTELVLRHPHGYTTVACNSIDLDVAEQFTYSGSLTSVCPSPD